MFTQIKIVILFYFCIISAFRLFITNNLGKTKVNYYIGTRKPLKSNETHEADKTKEIMENCPLFSFFWHDCKQCKDLIQFLEQNKIKYYYINSRNYFDHGEIGDEVEPQFYKDEVYIGNRIIDFYAAIRRINQ